MGAVAPPRRAWKKARWATGKMGWARHIAARAAGGMDCRRNAKGGLEATHGWTASPVILQLLSGQEIMVRASADV